ncbi:uncharacterized protein [Dermacentor albipictus]|uniref:uncharacterized protein n=1 Tax=Dermacentor albipictus TaxID=60249 RepID=UPI0038FD263B
MVALLPHINARDTFDILSSTDLPQLWGKELKAGVKDKYVPRKIVDLPCSKKATSDHAKLPTEDTLNRLLHALPYSSTAFRHSESTKDFYLATTTHQNLELQSIGLVISKENPCIGASPDVLVTCSCCATRVLEVKCPVNLERFQAKELTTLSNGKLSLKKTSRYFCQIQVQMGILEVEIADFFLFQDSENLLLLKANFDREFFSTAVERAVYIFKSYVLPYVTH